VQQIQREHRTGEPAPGAPAGPGHQGFAVSGRVGLDHLHECLDGLWSTAARGDLVACGFGFGASPVFLAAYLHAADRVPPGQRRRLWVVDAFRPVDGHADLNQAREALHRFGVLDDRIRFLQGDPGATLGDVAAAELALLHLGPGPAEHLRLALERLHPRLVDGGLVVVEDASAPGVEEALATFRSAAGVTAPIERVGRALHWVKEGEPAPAPTVPEARRGASRAPLARPTGFIAPDLSVVVVLHNMRREAERSLHSLSRRYQQSVDGVRYEVVVVENGSDPDQRLGEELVRRTGREFRYVDMGPDATSSPAPAMNRGIHESRGNALALMIDGAHVLTPRVLHHGLAGLAAYAPAVVATQPWYVGPGQQGEAMRSGYDTAVEDELFGRICWPDDGYRLFEIGHFIGDRDWFDGLWESNCLFASRKLLEQVGGFDEGFAMAGGGYTNLDLYERLTSSPDVRVVSILGEGSFHQVHGGTTTNLTDPQERRQRVRSYTDHFAELRGRPFQGPEKTIHYVGGFHAESARRTRSRRMTAKAFEVDRELEGIDGPAAPPPIPMPDDLRDAFTTAYYRSLAWQETTWLGQPVPNAATDLVAYQELLSEVRPDWIVETGTRDGGRALFLATICDLVGHGRVVSVGPRWQRARKQQPLPEHPRLTYVEGGAHDPAVIEAVHRTVGPEPHALVILGTRGPRMRTSQEFEAYAPLVRPGSYVVVEHTVVNGFPVDASFGPGPHEALRRILNLHGEFLSDTSREKHGLTFNIGGFLRRLS
jgi:cephalosporin hydroxylase